MLWRQTAFAALVLIVSVVASVVASVWLRVGRDAPPFQAAVIGDGFAVLDGFDPLRVHRLDDRGGSRGSVVIDQLPAEARVVGVGGEIALVWQDGRKVAIAELADDGQLGTPQRFGTRVKRVCEGTATNEHRFGVAYLESDDTMWFVNGPSTSELAVTTPREKTYCAIASAERKIALVWREANRVELNLCGKRCSSRVSKVAIDGALPILGIACTRDACVFAQRVDRGVRLSWVKHSGKRVWHKPLPDATPDGRVSLVAAAERIAIAYETSGEPAVRLADRHGALDAIWQGPADQLPALASANGKLLIARKVDGALVTTVR
ncbi:MAG: hypothetical protein WKG01_30200 [Kofleriaceae bacterium]